MRKLTRYLRAASCLLILAASATSATAATAGFDREAWLRDYAALKQALERDYANLAWFGSPQGGVDLPALDRFTVRALRSAENDAQARLAIRDFIAGFHDGHFSVLSTLQPAAQAADDPPAPRLRGLDAAAGCAALGYGANAPASFSLPFESLPGFELESDGVGSPFRSGSLTRADGQRMVMIRIKEFSRESYLPTCIAAWTKAKVATSQDSDDDLRSTIEAIADEQWYAALVEQLKALARRPAALLIVDVGHNSGGDDSGDIATRLFTDRPVHSSALLVSQAAAGGAYLDEQIESLQKGLDASPNAEAKRVLDEQMARFVNARGSLQAAPCDLSWVWREQRSWTGGGCRRLVAAGSAGGPLDYLPAGAYSNARVAKHLHWPSQMDEHWNAWNGPLYVLTDAGTHSAAEMFAATLQNNGLAKIVGEHTGGDGCGFMVKAKPLTLPHSHLRVRMPNCTRLRADGSDEVAGIEPDLPIQPREGESSRARALRLIDGVVADRSAFVSGQAGH